ncbi:MAG: hypothetical protein WCJ57_04085 [Candidatus Falkowbacteria bacterium]
MDDPGFDRIYVHPNHDESQLKELVETAINNGFQCLEYIEVKTEEQIQSLVTRKNYAIVLQKVGNDLSISDKSMSQITKHMTDKDVKIYSPEKAMEWILETTSKKTT